MESYLISIVVAASVAPDPLRENVLRFSLATVKPDAPLSDIQQLLAKVVASSTEQGRLVLIQQYLSDVLNVSVPDIKLTGNSWNERIAPWIWAYIHNTSRWADRNTGIDGKRHLITFYQMFILCSLCRNHYIDSIPALIRGLQKASMEDLFLAFHTYISLDTRSGFEYSEKLIKREFSSPSTLY